MPYRRFLFRGALVALAAVATSVGIRAALAPSDEPSRRSSTTARRAGDQIVALIEADAKQPRFDGMLHGWRIAPGVTLEAAGISAQSRTMRCTGTSDGSTPLDFTVTYTPPQLSGWGAFERLLCGTTATSVYRTATVASPHGHGTVIVERKLWDHAAYPINAAEGRVSAGTIRGRPAILVEPLDRTYGFGDSLILIIEDGVFDPYAQLVQVNASNLPWDEVRRFAEGIR